MAGQFGGWTPIGAEITGSGYEVAWKVQGQDQYTVWNTDSSGNYVGNAIGAVSGSNAALEALETSFHQDLNGDGTIGASPTKPTTVQSVSVQLGSNAFDGATLTLDTLSTFVGRIVGFAGDGILDGSDQIDLRGVEFGSVHSSFATSTDTLAVTDGATTTNLRFAGHYTLDNFHFADDGNGGTIVYGATSATQAVTTPVTRIGRRRPRCVRVRFRIWSGCHRELRARNRRDPTQQIRVFKHGCAARRRP